MLHRRKATDTYCAATRRQNIKGGQYFQYCGQAYVSSPFVEEIIDLCGNWFITNSLSLKDVFYLLDMKISYI
jgi:hypothetical protein